MPTAVWKSWIEGPKSLRVPEELRISAQAWGLTIERLDVEKRWLHETTVFEISGPADKVQRFARVWCRLIDDLRADQ